MRVPSLPLPWSARGARALDSAITAEQRSIPTLLHITHYKAGSQWIKHILETLAPERIVEPEIMSAHLERPLLDGCIYPTLYISREEFLGLRCPAGTRHFVIIRDLRDTLISFYFSLLVSHPIIDPIIANWRERLEALSRDDGLLCVLDEGLNDCGRIQASWVASGEPLIRFEDLLDDDVAILERTIFEVGSWGVPRERFLEIVEANRFERYTGRSPGTELLESHERKGIAGDWQNHFSERVKRAFKERYGDLLIASGYERDANW